MRRISVNTGEQVERGRNKGEHYSEFLITVNPNKSFVSTKNGGFDMMVEKLDKLGEFLLKKDNLINLLVFESRDGIERDREDHLRLISEIDPGRRGVVEWGIQQHRLHLHITFWIKHYTFLQINRELFGKVASKLLGMPEGSFHVDFKGSGRASFKEYVDKFNN